MRMMNKDIKARAYCFNHKFLWIGWIIVQRGPKSFLYADNSPYMTLENELNMEYVTFGLSKKSVMKRLEKYIKKEWEENYD